MSKVVKIQDGDYKLITQLDGTITLDTGNQIGRVVITGDLIVQGNTTTVDSETLAIRDNIIYINKDEVGAGVTLGTAGFSIERGSLTDVSLLFDEASDTFRFIDGLGSLVPLQSSYIRSSGDLRLIGGGNGVLTVTGTVDYETNVTDDDDIPNRRFLTDYVLAVGGVAVVDRFYRYSGSIQQNTGGRAYDTGAGDGSSRVSFEVDGVIITEINSNGVEIDGALTADQVRITENYITSIDSNNNLELRASGTGLVLVDDVLGLGDQISTPAATSGQSKIYSTSTVGTGGTGIRFVNTTTNGELISSKKALLYALLF
jgi:hypothetical protein